MTFFGKEEQRRERALTFEKSRSRIIDILGFKKKTESKPSEAGSIRKGAATECVRSDFLIKKSLPANCLRSSLQCFDTKSIPRGAFRPKKVGSEPKPS